MISLPLDTRESSDRIALFEMVWEAGYRFDSIVWPDDMDYRQNQFFSVDMYRQLLKPVHKRAIDWAKTKASKLTFTRAAISDRSSPNSSESALMP